MRHRHEVPQGRAQGETERHRDPHAEGGEAGTTPSSGECGDSSGQSCSRWRGEVKQPGRSEGEGTSKLTHSWSDAGLWAKQGMCPLKKILGLRTFRRGEGGRWGGVDQGEM